MADIDLSVQDNLLAYLSNGPFASTKVIPLFGPGGGANFTFRLILQIPYNGKHSAIVKHGKPYISSMQHVPFDLYRQKFEVTAMRNVKSALPADSLVTVPEIYVHDDKANIIIMEDNADITTPSCTTQTVKELLLCIGDDRPTDAVVRTLGSGIGKFLSSLHRWGSDEAQQELLKFFDKNEQGKRLYAWANYGRSQETLANPTSADVPALTDPPFPISPSDLDTLEETGKKMSELIYTSRDTLSQGDFWPGNILVRIRKLPEETIVEQVFVVDWEIVRPGFNGFDLGQFLAELHQAQSFGPTEISANVTALRSSFLQAYKEGMGQTVDMEKVASVAMAHMGGHLVSWTPRVWTWAEKEKIRGVVADGVNYLLNHSNREAVDSSPLRILTTAK